MPESPANALHRREIGFEELDADVDAGLEEAPQSDDSQRKTSLRVTGIAASLVAVVLIVGLATAPITDFMRGETNEQIPVLASLDADSATLLTMGDELEERRQPELDRPTRVYDHLAGELIPGDRGPAPLRPQLAVRLERERQDRLAMELRARLQKERGSLNSLADFRRVQNDLMMLANLRPQDSMLKDLRWQLQQIFLSGFDALMAKQRWQEAQDLLVDFARFFDIPYIATRRAQLSDAEKAHDFHSPATQSRRNLLAERAKTISELLRQPVLTPEWEAAFETAFKENLAMVGTEGSGVRLVSRAMMLLYRDRAVVAVKAKQYLQAQNLLGKGRAYMPDAGELDEIERMLVDAQQTVLGKLKSTSAATSAPDSACCAD